MPYFKFQNIRISAVASAVPKQVVKADDFVKTFGAEYVEKFKHGTGILEYRKSRDHQTASDLAYAAAENIFAQKQINRDEIGALVFGALSHDYRRPTTACVLHKRLGLSKNCAAFDVNLGCSAFVYGLTTVCALMQSSNIDKALLLVGETVSKLANPKDSSTAMLFGDGGAAVLFEKTKDAAPIESIVKTDGMGYQTIIAPAGGFRNINPVCKDVVWGDGNVRNLYNTHMQGDNVFSFTISDVPRTIKEFLQETGTTVSDYDCFAFHQANKFIIEMMAKKLKVSIDSFPICLDRYGNCSAPSIPIVICDKYGNDDSNGTIRLMMCGFGVGLSWGVCSAVINSSDILPIIESDEIYTEGIINEPNDFLNVH